MCYPFTPSLSKMFHNLKIQHRNQIRRKVRDFQALRESGVVGNQNLSGAAVDCALALFHFREHFPVDQRLSRKNITQQCPDYKIIADVANAAKHNSIDKAQPDGPTLIASISDIYELLIIINFDDPVSPYSHGESVVLAKCTDGIERCLDESIVNVANFWGRELHRLGIDTTEEINQLPYPGSEFIRREDAKRLDIEFTQGLPYPTFHQFMRFDYSEGVA
jgi:hypothetical protein